MFLLAAMGIGAAIGGVAGLVTYAVKSRLTKKPFRWKEAAAYSIGGIVGGGLFPPLMAGLAALGLPTLASYIVAGGLSWGGIWTFAQDFAAVKLGVQEKLGSVSHYLTATLVGLVVTALLTPAAVRVVNPGMKVAVREMTTRSFVGMSRPYVANAVKSEAEFLLFGAAVETANAGVRAISRSGARALVRNTARPGAATGGRGAREALTPTATNAANAAHGEAERSPEVESTAPRSAEERAPRVRSRGLRGALRRTRD